MSQPSSYPAGVRIAGSSADGLSVLWGHQECLPGRNRVQTNSNTIYCY